MKKCIQQTALWHIQEGCRHIRDCDRYEVNTFRSDWRVCDWMRKFYEIFMFSVPPTLIFSTNFHRLSNSFWVENQIQKFFSWWNGKSQESPTKNFYRLNLLPLFRHVSIVKMFGNFLPTKISNSKYFHETKFTRVKLEKSGNFYSYELNVKNVKNLV